MGNMFEKLESRNLFSVSVHVAGPVLAHDIAVLDRPLPAILTTYQATLRNMRNDLKFYNFGSDVSLMETVQTDFAADYSITKSDLKVGKSLFNRDIKVLDSDIVQAKRHSQNPAWGDKVVFDENLLMAQAQHAATALAEDASRMEDDLDSTISAIVQAHPIDATLAAQHDHLLAAVNSGFDNITGDADQILASDAGQYIQAVDPTYTIANPA